ncbi:DsbA family protein [Streptomyces sp. NPDC057137]|uniref:DsbA family oxidoreductase n=1 Tax=Streptomyces sp. NPDC057137 TaxID=3346030 RepID=UPI00363DC086
MKLDTWSEVIRPRCGLGHHRVERAVERFEHGDQVKVVHHSFPISGSFPEGRIFSTRKPVLDNQVGNTDLAHEFLAHASAHGKNRAAWERVQNNARRAERLGERGAPFIVIDSRYAVPGAQVSYTLLDLPRTPWADTRPVTPVAGDAPVRGPDGCAVPECA